MLAAAQRTMTSSTNPSCAAQITEDRRASLRSKIRELRVGMQELRSKKPRSPVKICTDCGEAHMFSKHKSKSSAGNNPLTSPLVTTKPIAPRLSLPLPAPSYSQHSKDILWSGPPTPSPSIPADVIPELVDEDDDDDGSCASTVVLETSSENEEEVVEEVFEEDHDQGTAAFRFEQISKGVAEFDGTFEEYLVELAKSSNDDLNACRRVREYLRSIPASEFTCNINGDRDEVMVTDRGLRLLCVLINTPKSVALWNKASRFIEDPSKKADLSSVFCELPLIGNHVGVSDEDDYWKKHDFDNVDDMVDVVEDAWKTASLGGYSSQEEFEEEQRFIQRIRSEPSPRVPPIRVKMLPEAYERLRAEIGQLKRKNSSSSSDPDQKTDAKRKKKKKKRRNGRSGKSTTIVQ